MVANSPGGDRKNEPYTIRDDLPALQILTRVLELAKEKGPEYTSEVARTFLRGVETGKKESKTYKGNVKILRALERQGLLGEEEIAKLDQLTLTRTQRYAKRLRKVLGPKDEKK